MSRKLYTRPPANTGMKRSGNTARLAARAAAAHYNKELACKWASPGVLRSPMQRKIYESLLLP